jgi:hypothetical protein
MTLEVSGISCPAGRAVASSATNLYLSSGKKKCSQAKPCEVQSFSCKVSGQTFALPVAINGNCLRKRYPASIKWSIRSIAKPKPLAATAVAAKKCGKGPLGVIYDVRAYNMSCSGAKGALKKARWKSNSAGVQIPGWKCRITKKAVYPKRTGERCQKGAKVMRFKYGG